SAAVDPAIDAFHPATPHQYAVILRDDTEVSPLFYVWLKRAILRYRYAAPPDSRADYGLPDIFSLTRSEPPGGLAGIALSSPDYDDATAG
ncbi:unnamed protein product, partial [Phaeothamnion confervicola]